VSVAASDKSRRQFGRLLLIGRGRIHSAGELFHCLVPLLRPQTPKTETARASTTELVGILQADLVCAAKHRASGRGAFSACPAKQLPLQVAPTCYRF
jgi:hypothetical protein